MPIQAHIPQCTHIRMTGTRCGSPAMRGANKCYYHLRPPKIDDLQLRNVADPEEQMKAITQIVNALMQNKIDHKRASALLYGIQVANQKRDQLARLNRGASMQRTNNV